MDCYTYQSENALLADSNTWLNYPRGLDPKKPRRVFEITDTNSTSEIKIPVCDPRWYYDTSMVWSDIIRLIELYKAQKSWKRIGSKTQEFKALRKKLTKKARAWQKELMSE